MLTALGTHAFHFCYPIDAESVDACLDDFEEAEQSATLELILNTPGGGVLAGMALLDYIRWLRMNGRVVVASCMGMAASIAPIVMQAATVRVIGAESYMLIHPITVIAEDEDSEITGEKELIEMLSKRTVDILAERSTLSVDEITSCMSSGHWWLDARSALAAGLVDEIR